MRDEILEYRRQARGPRNYLALGLVLAVTYAGWSQGWGLVAVLLCGPALGFLLARLVENEAEGFRMSEAGLDYYDGNEEAEFGWYELSGVTIANDGFGGAVCALHLVDGRTVGMHGTRAFAPGRLAEEFRQRGIPVWMSDAPVAELAAA